MNRPAEATALPTRDVGALTGSVERLRHTIETLLTELRGGPTDAAPATAVSAHEQLRELRAAMPKRVLGLSEGRRIAERQAALLRWQLNRTTTPALPTEAMTGLPFLTVLQRSGLGKSALVTRTDRGWVIVLRADEPQVRQKFSLAHEIKHLLDDPLAAACPSGLYRAPGRDSNDLAELVCDHFAACLLMPKLLLRRDWTSGLQDAGRLARRYRVSTRAMDVRLRTLGLIEPVPRCSGAPTAADK